MNNPILNENNTQTDKDLKTAFGTIPSQLKKKIMNNSESNKLDNDSYDVPLVLQSTLNSAAVFPAFIRNKQVTIGLSYNRKTSGMKAQVKFHDNNKHKIVYKTFRKLDDSLFANKFFNLINIENDTSDFRSKFEGLKEENKNKIKQFKSEFFNFNYPFDTKLKESELNAVSQNTLNYLLITGWELVDNSTDLVYFLAERGIYNKSKNTMITRSIGLQIGVPSFNSEVEPYFAE